MWLVQTRFEYVWYVGSLYHQIKHQIAHHTPSPTRALLYPPPPLPGEEDVPSASLKNPFPGPPPGDLPVAVAIAAVSIVSAPSAGNRALLDMVVLPPVAPPRLPLLPGGRSSEGGGPEGKQPLQNPP